MNISYTDYQDLLIVSNTADLGFLESHQTTAWRRYFPTYIGIPLMEELKSSSYEADPIMEYIKPALAFLTVFEAIPFLDLVLTGSGFGIVQNQNLAPASAHRVESLTAAALQSGNTAVDTLLWYLETNQEQYPSWNKSCVLDNPLIQTIDDFETVESLNGSRLAFISHIPRMKLWYNQRIIPRVGMMQLEEFRALSVRRGGEVSEGGGGAGETGAEALLRSALVHFTLANAENKLMPHAEKDLLLAVSLMTNNPTQYPEYHEEMYEPPYKNNETDFPVFGY